MTSIRVYSDLGLASIRLHKTGAFRAWTLARQLDQDGQGWVNLADLYDLAEVCKVNRRTWFYWMAQAREEGFFMEGRPGVIRLLSLEKTARALQVDRIRRRFDLPERKLAGHGWRAYIFASIHNGKPTSRQTLKELTGITCRTQARYDKIAKVKRKSSIYGTNCPASELPGAIEYGREPTNFIYFNQDTGERLLAHKRPDSRKPYGKPELIRAKWKVNQELNSAVTCIYSNSVRQRDNGLRVIFHNSREQAERAARQNGKNDVTGEVFYRVKRTRKADLYLSV